MRERSLWRALLGIEKTVIEAVEHDDGDQDGQEQRSAAHSAHLLSGAIPCPETVGVGHGFRVRADTAAMTTDLRGAARLADAIGGELPADSRSAFDAHLRECVGCRREYEALRATIADARSLPLPARINVARVGEQLILSEVRETAAPASSSCRTITWKPRTSKSSACATTTRKC